ncbi:MAG: glycosyltransferase family 2 protein [Candidatus Latescibacteria bacterium]|jgi:glycosyltransferase involved in cell wall biosynthesis|nr:glycosyltransferase family 2 protein [Candidatus Latescibacterota bacterium]
MNVALIIPAFNAASTISRLLHEAGMFFVPDNIVVVDDGSTDGTGGLAESLGVSVLRHPDNRGKGAALKTGFGWALDNGFDGVVTMDADGQHACSDLPALLQAAEEDSAGVVLGSRMSDPGSMPWQRRLSNRLTSSIISLRTGQTVTDSQSGYRYVSADVLRSVSLTSDRFQAESELLIKSALAGVRIRAIPVASIYTGGGSAIRPFLDTWRFVLLVFRSLFWSAGKPADKPV